MEKNYQALVEGCPKREKGTLVNWLLKDEKKNKVEVFDEERVGALRAELDYKIIEKKGHNSLLEINLKTGRPHQIRSQLVAIGYPIVGDVKYGAKQKTANGSIALSAVRLSFDAVVGGERKTIETQASFEK